MRALAKVLVVALAAGMGVALAYRMTPEAMAVVVGVVFGVLATIPVGLVVLALARRQRGEPGARMQHPASPPVVVIQPPATPQPQGRAQDHWLPDLPLTLHPGPERDFRIIGDDE